MSALPGDAVIVALAGRRYAVERNWGRLPADVPPAMVSQVAVDRQGRVHVFRRGSPPVAVFTSGGSFAFGYGDGRITFGIEAEIEKAGRWTGPLRLFGS